MSTRIIPVDDFDLVIFGATGDLSQRKLFPALFHRDEQGQIRRCLHHRHLPPGHDHEDFRAFAAEAIDNYVEGFECAAS